jgi:hypothetical protein
MTRLIGDLLSFRRSRANENTRPTDAVRVQDLLPAVARMLGAAGREEEGHLSIEAAADLPAVVGEPTSFSRRSRTSCTTPSSTGGTAESSGGRPP